MQNVQSRIHYLLIPLFCFPAFAAIKMYRVDPVWIVTSIVISASMVELFSSSSTAVRFTTRLLLLVAVVLNLLYMSSVAIQGQGFNDAFFYHLDPSVLFSDSRIYLLVGGSLALLIFIWILSRPRRLEKQKNSIKKLGFTAGMLVLGISAFPPFDSLISHIWKVSHVNTTVTTVLAARFADKRLPVKPMKPRNLVFIYMESLERTYFVSQQQPDMMPALSRIEAKSLNFTNLRQMPNTGWTMGGMVSSQCGIPLFGKYDFELNELGSAMPRFMPSAHCLGDILRTNGYTLSFYNAADVRFGGKGPFLSQHGYDTVIGRGTIDQKVSEADKDEGWGIHDDILFPIVEKHYDEAVKEWQRTGQPFVISTLTVDNHPNFDMLSKSCQKYGAGVDLYNAAHCSDQTISRFIEHIRQSPGSENTTIVAMSDHLNFTLEALKRFGPETNRRLTLLINQPGGEHRDIDTMGTHFDIGPTVLEALGFTGNTRIGMGQSLLSNAQGFLPTHFAPDVLESVVNSKQVKDYVGSRWNSSIKHAEPILVRPRTVTLGDQVFTVAPFEKFGLINYFLIKFDTDGSVDDISSYLTEKAFARAIYLSRNRVVLAVAPTAGLNKVFRGFHANSPQGGYFLGKPSSDGVGAGVVDQEASFSKADVNDAQAQRSVENSLAMFIRLFQLMF
ncbi:sulfatase-like hydrolase/transferase [Caballeronia sp. GAWG2-1]|uniref:sulfatase-like hydrolase/transferase n=1 Tax=Caballeronia sp. GAWG2-1 TaxID=2921744 RepID=UPI00202821D0|nr:sulfatase-like hydrolase/transferase [Caballeronia sp. GAWG2-1]